MTCKWLGNFFIAHPLPLSGSCLTRFCMAHDTFQALVTCLAWNMTQVHRFPNINAAHETKKNRFTQMRLVFITLPVLITYFWLIQEQSIPEHSHNPESKSQASSGQSHQSWWHISMPWISSQHEAPIVPLTNAEKLWIVRKTPCSFISWSKIPNLQSKL